MKRFLLPILGTLCLIFILSLPGFGQALDSTAAERSFIKLDLFPAISYSPETNLTFGVIGIRYFDFSKGDLSTSLSNLEFLSVYTLNNQIIIESRWEVFSPKNLWRFRGEAFFQRYPDRNYGLGNKAGTLVLITNEDEMPDTVNYLSFESDRIKFAPAVLRKIAPNFYFGLNYELEHLYRMKATPESHFFINSDSTRISGLPISGTRSGIGFQLLFDNRDYILNPLKGTFLSLNNLNYTSLLGSDYQYTSFFLDARQYINPFKNHTLALRFYGAARFSDEAIPMRGLSRVGGHKFIRGYFSGTYQDRHLAAFEAEYRLPFWREGTDAKFGQFWKRLGIVVFVGGAQVAHEMSDFHFDRFNFSVGGGLRILFNPQSRVNLRIDYAIGLQKGAGGINKQQSGLYFYLGEAF